MSLRPYQETAVVSALDALTRRGSAVLQMPTGAGKTKAATEIIKRLGKPVWFICHRQEIERQAAKAFRDAGIDFGVISPRAEPEQGKNVQIVSVGSLMKRIDDLPLPSAVIWDECHHVAAKSWAAIREALASAQHLGLTATPERLDGKGLGEWFSELVTGPSTRELIDGGHLSEFRYFAPSDPDLTAAKLQAGDYKKADMAKVMNTPVLIGDAIAEYKAKADGKRALVFAASVEASKAIVDRFNAEGIAAAHVDGTTPTEERDTSIAALKAGDIKVLSNVEVFTEGFDLPAIDAVIMMRPTKSVALFLQMIGRVLRVSDGKDEALIFDHAGLWLDHGWFDSNWNWSLEGGAKKSRQRDGYNGARRCPSCKEVRGERMPVCACGYAFPTGKDIGEFDGILSEFKKRKRPEGHVDIFELQRLLRINQNQRRHLEKERRYGKYINLREELETLRRLNLGIIPPVFSSRRESYLEPFGFNRRYKISMSAAEKLSGMEIRKHANGWPDERSAEEVIAALRRIYMPMPEFNRMLGQTSSQTFKRFALPNGIPHLKAGGYPSTRWVHIQSALEWIRDNTDIEIPPESWLAANDNRKLMEAA